MKKLFLTLFAVISVILSTNAYNINESIGLVTIPSFNKINVNTNARVCVIHSDSFSIIVNGQEDNVKNVKFKVEDGILKIESIDENIGDKVRILITTPEKDSPKISTSSNFILKDVTKTV